MRLTALNQLIQDGRTIDGVWELTPRHGIRYRKRGRDETVVLTADLVAAEPAGLTLQVTGEQVDQDLVGQIVTLRGRWQADAANRLTFLVERAGGRYDRLILGGGWRLGAHHEILYHVRRHSGVRPERAERVLTLRGRWDASVRHQLTYVLDARRDSTFRFRGTFQSPTVQAKTGELRYQLGVEVDGQRRRRILTFFGKWKLSRALALSFELPTTDGKFQTLTFGATFSPDSRSTVTATLTGRDGRPLGLEVVFTRTFLKGQGEAFLRLRRALEDSAVEGGVRFRW